MYRSKKTEPKVEFSAIDSVLSERDAAADDFEQTHLKPNLPLIEARNKVEPPVLPGLRYRPGSCSLPGYFGVNQNVLIRDELGLEGAVCFQSFTNHFDYGDRFRPGWIWRLSRSRLT